MREAVVDSLREHFPQAVLEAPRVVSFQSILSHAEARLEGCQRLG